jgi:hypothetical protein
MKIKLTNGFHNTEVVLISRNGELSTRQIKRAKRVLCGLRGCRCSDDAGCRGNQEVTLEYYWTDGIRARVI